MERLRFQGKPFVVVARRDAFDYDGLRKTVELVEGFATQEAAIECAKRCAEEARQASLSEPPGRSGFRWHIVEGPQITQDDTPSEPQTVPMVFREFFRLATGSGYDELYFAAAVFHVTSAELIGPEFFAALDCEWEVTAYLMRVGKGGQLQAKPDTAPDSGTN